MIGFFFYALASVSAQSTANLPSCAVSCLGSSIAATGCAATNVGCICSSNIIAAVEPCVKAACSEADKQNVVSYAQGLCAAGGVSITVPADFFASGQSSAASTVSSAARSSQTSSSAAVRTTTSASQTSSSTAVRATTSASSTTSATTAASSTVAASSAETLNGKFSIFTLLGLGLLAI